MNAEVIRESVLRAGEAVLKARPTEGIITKEGRGNYVTAADLASEKIIIGAIQKNFPDHSILSEETESHLGDLLLIDHLWVIDPIDGTSNFRYGRDYSGISVGYVEKGVPQVGFIYNPFRNEFFHAERGKGAFVNDRQIEVSAETDLAKATVITGNSYEPKITRSNLEMLLKIPQTPWVLIRGSAVLEYCDIAAGRADLFAHQAVKPWDNAAAFVILQEAGAVIKGLNGEDVNFTASSLVTGNKTLVDQFLEAIK